MGTVAGKNKRERIDNVDINFLKANLISHPSTLIIILREKNKRVTSRYQSTFSKRYKRYLSSLSLFLSLPLFHHSFSSSFFLFYLSFSWFLSLSFFFLSLFLSLCLSLCLSVCQSLCLSVSLFLCPSLVHTIPFSHSLSLTVPLSIQRKLLPSKI